MSDTPIASTPYYLNDFMAVINGVVERYGAQLNAEEHAYLAKLGALPAPALMLYARLVNRKGPYFRLARLDYSEIADIETAVQELVDAGLLERIIGENASAEVLACFTYPELKAALQGYDPARTCRRPELLAWLGQWDGFGSWMASFLVSQSVICLPASDPFGFVRFLFFGELRPNLADFVTRALGHIVTETVAPEALRPRFTCRREMDDAYRMAVLYQEFRRIRESRTTIGVLDWWMGYGITRENLSAGQEWFDRLIDRLGRLLERAGETAAAAALYASSPVAPARERRARLLLRSGEPAQATALLQPGSCSPGCSFDRGEPKPGISRSPPKRWCSTIRRAAWKQLYWRITLARAGKACIRKTGYGMRALACCYGTSSTTRRSAFSIRHFSSPRRICSIRISMRGGGSALKQGWRCWLNRLPRWKSCKTIFKPSVASPTHLSPGMMIYSMS